MAAGRCLSVSVKLPASNAKPTSKSDKTGTLATLVREFQGLRLGQPRWHETRVRNSYDLAAVLLDILVGEQRKRPCLTGPVTRGTIFKDDGARYRG